MADILPEFCILITTNKAYTMNKYIFVLQIFQTVLKTISTGKVDSVNNNMKCLLSFMFSFQCLFVSESWETQERERGIEERENIERKMGVRELRGRGRERRNMGGEKELKAGGEKWEKEWGKDKRA